MAQRDCSVCHDCEAALTRPTDRVSCVTKKHEHVQQTMALTQCHTELTFFRVADGRDADLDVNADHVHLEQCHEDGNVEELTVLYRCDSPLPQA